ncbi:hypothetical protein L226DRAFT_610631 [Lentinus tigrinus ALCF2SS1-7]|uniref:Uncharacterized protein n=1 Tax=Lentinus tigrinus ALCF2SS1-6 TaxID=1328759 RepID=A0A5C2S231_9APHY|nr:hypothetical protein L227DRAFT_530269 [Lentinus tigrinus ALCF2SS1-6]RPD78798.1 hypothetical protein L226DRAFT_610631 [Lentinus tigrinus ALCF2SS1-7]
MSLHAVIPQYWSETIPEPLPPSPFELIANPGPTRARYINRHPRTFRHSRIPLPFISRLLGWTPPDTPSAAFYRLYELLVLDINIQFRNELEYFCTSHPDWSVSSIPDPADFGDPLRYAVLAVLTQLMCDAFNRRIALGLPRDAPPIIQDFDEVQARPKVFEQPPDWAPRVKPLEDKVFLPNGKGEVFREDDEENICKRFKSMNIIAQMAHIHFI